VCLVSDCFHFSLLGAGGVCFAHSAHLLTGIKPHFYKVVHRSTQGTHYLVLQQFQNILILPPKSVLLNSIECTGVVHVRLASVTKFQWNFHLLASFGKTYINLFLRQRLVFVRNREVAYFLHS